MEWEALPGDKLLVIEDSVWFRKGDVITVKEHVGYNCYLTTDRGRVIHKSRVENLSKKSVLVYRRKE